MENPGVGGCHGLLYVRLSISLVAYTTPALPRVNIGGEYSIKRSLELKVEQPPPPALTIPLLRVLGGGVTGWLAGGGGHVGWPQNMLGSWWDSWVHWWDRRMVHIIMVHIIMVHIIMVHIIMVHTTECGAWRGKDRLLWGKPFHCGQLFHCGASCSIVGNSSIVGQAVPLWGNSSIVGQAAPLWATVPLQGKQFHCGATVPLGSFSPLGCLLTVLRPYSP